mmetsp:Transcript_9050/g.28453  ORF Transcript_9050/g.28453 Transcript_9050/m.28453 type:complete len:280 (-) Transcript_9050:151-990(-)
MRVPHWRSGERLVPPRGRWAARQDDFLAQRRGRRHGRRAVRRTAALRRQHAAGLRHAVAAVRHRRGRACLLPGYRRGRDRRARADGARGEPAERADERGASRLRAQARRRACAPKARAGRRHDRERRRRSRPKPRAVRAALVRLGRDARAASPPLQRHGRRRGPALGLRLVRRQVASWQLPFKAVRACPDSCCPVQCPRTHRFPGVGQSPLGQPTRRDSNVSRGVLASDPTRQGHARMLRARRARPALLTCRCITKWPTWIWTQSSVWQTSAAPVTVAR